MPELQGKVASIVPGGLGCVRTESHPIYVRQAAVGDALVLSEPHKRYGRLHADIERVVQVSSQRVSPACDVAKQCGGCALQYIDSTVHAEIKSQWVFDAFQQAIMADTQREPVCVSALTGEHCRRRLRWHISRLDHGKLVLGFRAYQSHDVVASHHCMVITDELNALRLLLQEKLAEYEHLPVAVYAVQLSNGIHVVFEYDTPVSMMPESLDWQGLPLQLWFKLDGITRPLHKPVLALQDTLPTFDRYINIDIGADDFVQGQYAGNQQMIAQILQWSVGARYVVDLFSGVGNLSLPLAASGMQVRGAEVNQASVRAANRNSKALQLDALYQQADLFAQFDTSMFVGADILIVDPPRKGAKHICAMMNILLPKKVILVHCDVLSAARDSKEMLRQGFHLKALRALDLFPYSGHVESMSLWVY